jgi:hypothetical protein
MRKGQNLVCTRTINNAFDDILFEKDKVYEVLYVDNEKVHTLVYLNHNLIGNEYQGFELSWVLENFKVYDR